MEVRHCDGRPLSEDDRRVGTSRIFDIEPLGIEANMDNELGVAMASQYNNRVFSFLRQNASSSDDLGGIVL